MNKYNFIKEKTIEKSEGVGEFMWIDSIDDFDKMYLDQISRDNTIKCSIVEMKEIQRISDRLTKRLNGNKSA